METRLGSGGSDPVQAGDSAATGPPIFAAIASPVRSFLEVPIHGDPTFDSIELQYLAWKVPEVGRQPSSTSDPLEKLNRSDFAALVHTPDGVDLYLDPKSAFDEEWFENDPAYANLKRAGFHRTPVRVKRWTIASDRVEVEASFQLADGRTVHLGVNQEAGKDQVLRQFIPTPAISNLNLLRFLQVEGFGLLRRSSKLTVTVEGQSLKPARFALPLGGKRRYAARYAAHCAVVGLNPNGDHILDQPGSNDLQWTFDPPLADLTSRQLADLDQSGTGDQPDQDHRQQEGTVRFRMGVGWVTTAHYVCRSTHLGCEVSLSQVEQGWKPPGRNLQLRVLGALRQLRRKDLTWHWSGTVQPDPASGPPALVDSTWTATP